MCLFWGVYRACVRSVPSPPHLFPPRRPPVPTPPAPSPRPPPLPRDRKAAAATAAATAGRAPPPRSTAGRTAYQAGSQPEHPHTPAGGRGRPPPDRAMKADAGGRWEVSGAPCCAAPCSVRGGPRLLPAPFPRPPRWPATAVALPGALAVRREGTGAARGLAGSAGWAGEVGKGEEGEGGRPPHRPPLPAFPRGGKGGSGPASGPAAPAPPRHPSVGAKKCLSSLERQSRANGPRRSA